MNILFHVHWCKGVRSPRVQAAVGCLPRERVSERALGVEPGSSGEQPVLLLLTQHHSPALRFSSFIIMCVDVHGSLARVSSGKF